MKKLMFAISLCLLAGAAYAACVGGQALCYDDSGVTVNAVSLVNGTGVGIPFAALATILNSTPTVKGQLMYCTDCTKSAVCVSTAAVHHSYVAVSSNSIAACL